MTSDWTWEHWAWACLFVGGAFYMTIDVSRRLSGWLFSKILPTRYRIAVGQGDEQNRVTVWAYSLERAIIKAAAKDGYQHIMERIGCTSMPWKSALKLNIAWMLGYGWKIRRNIKSQEQGGIDAMLMSMIERCSGVTANCWSYRRGLWLICLRSAELEAQKPEEKKPEDEHAQA